VAFPSLLNSLSLSLSLSAAGCAPKPLHGGAARDGPWRGGGAEATALVKAVRSVMLLAQVLWCDLVDLWIHPIATSFSSKLVLWYEWGSVGSSG